MFTKVVAFLAILFLFSLASSLYMNSFATPDIVATSVHQLDEGVSRADQTTVRQKAHVNDAIYYGSWFIVVLVSGTCLFGRNIKDMLKKLTVLPLLLIALMSTGCIQPYQVPILEEISPNEEAFLIPYTGDAASQTSSNNEEYLKKNLVFTKQVLIPQQWIQQGRMSNYGEWRPAAVLVKVDKSPVTREWTADANSGTSNRNEAIWVMTSDQVEFSTGWTATARIATREDAVKFLHNYPNGSLAKVLDSEVRAKIQTEFGLEVTDLPMETLRKAATPHIVKVIDTTTKFFKERGIQITNLGITGGFVYKDKTIADTMVKVFNAEQEKFVAMAESQAQQERNKKVQFDADGKAKALLTEREAEAKGIQAVADAKAYEIEKAQENEEVYVKLKTLEIQKAQLEKWDGKFPTYFVGGETPGTILFPAPSPSFGGIVQHNVQPPVVQPKPIKVPQPETIE